ncbi:class I SAM-dependent methyltransferase [Aquincola sp. MAHUQ-54]|uniref:Class I SAM-dependent methyltransferase n=1 Tax=Aquincola agrisoli TaxID=3119538 RepID=A0AAW9QM45_9BURK
MAGSPAAAIRTVPCPACPVCGATGAWLYRGLHDRLFGAPGAWGVRRCPGADCGSLWLDPSPLAADLGLAYARYYTHADRPAERPAPAARPLHRLLGRLHRRYLAERYGYGPAGRVRWGMLLMAGLRARRDAADGEVRLLPAQAGGRLLDVGCGSGEWLATMRRHGWQVAGVEFDDTAAALARSRGLAVATGTLEQQRFAPASFDAITLNHVIEHVPDPAATLRECARLLRPGGRLVLFTPNAASLGHAWFGACWRGLEPPRHLQVLSPPAMQRLLDGAGFAGVRVGPWVAPSIVRESALLRDGAARGRGAAWTSAWFCLAQRALLWWRPAWGDCIAATAQRP